MPDFRDLSGIFSRMPVRLDLPCQPSGVRQRRVVPSSGPKLPAVKIKRPALCGWPRRGLIAPSTVPRGGPSRSRRLCAHLCKELQDDAIEFVRLFEVGGMARPADLCQTCVGDVALHHLDHGRRGDDGERTVARGRHRLATHDLFQAQAPLRGEEASGRDHRRVMILSSHRHEDNHRLSWSNEIAAKCGRLDPQPHVLASPIACLAG
jgi:hypothetical protein